MFPEVPDWIVYVLIFGGFLMSFYFFLVLFTAQEKPKLKKLGKTAFIIPAKNAEHTLERCVKSVVDQNYRDFIYIIIVNDASTDRTLEIAKKLKRKFDSQTRKIIILTRKHSTGKKASAINHGLKYVLSNLKVQYIAVLDADTFIEKQALRDNIAYLQKPSIMGSTSWLVPYNKGNFWERMQKVEYVLTGFYRVLLGRVSAICVAPAFTVFRAEFFKKAGFYDEQTLTEDFEIALRLRSLGYDMAFTDNKVLTVVPSRFKDLRRQRIRWWHGTLQNIAKYKHLISIKQGALGTFFLPVALILGTLFLVTALFIIGYDILFKLTNFVHDLLLGVMPKLKLEINLFSLSLALSDPKVILVVFGFLFSLIFLFYARKTINEKINILEYCLFILCYGWILALFCIEAGIKYLFRWRVKW